MARSSCAFQVESKLPATAVPGAAGSHAQSAPPHLVQAKDVMEDMLGRVQPYLVRKLRHNLWVTLQRQP